MALPDLPDLFGFLACIGVRLVGTVHSLYVRKQVGQVGQVGQRKQRRGFPLPNLIGARSGRSGRPRRGGAAGWPVQVRRVLPSLAVCGLHGRKNAVVAEFELWFIAPSSGSLVEFSGVPA